MGTCKLIAKAVPMGYGLCYAGYAGYSTLSFGVAINCPMIGYIPLEQAQAAVDLVGHRLIEVSRVDLEEAGRVALSWERRRLR